MIRETDTFEKDARFSFTDIPDGLAVNDAEGKEIHFLNPTASAVYLLCDGKLDARAIAVILKEEFGLEEAPVDDVLGCLAELNASAIITKVA